ncbi:hypothetical protein CK203_019614 [Vitis vinifera]|uniref:Uncharacterized protein n=1 Tax=Vitis vinifera TaxID=29760 RepID=A0A438JQV1_VITVI|nr:hypothetical protein CK203_019614 [Vitis vinifera]
MDEVQNDLSQKIDNLQDSILRFANLNTVQEQENYPSQPYQNSKGIHEMEAKEGNKEVDLPTCKLEHEVESEAEKEKREEIKGKRKRKSTEKDDYVDKEPQRIVIKEEMKKHMHPLFLQALFLDDQNQDECAKLNENVAATPHFGNCWTHFDYFSKFKLCILYLILKLGKSRPRDHASKEESPLTKITHEASHSISYLLKPSKPIAPAKETMPSKETTRTEAKS